MYNNGSYGSTNSYGTQPTTGNYPNDLYNPGKVGGNQNYNPQRRDEITEREIQKDKHSIGFWFWLKEQVQFIYSSDVGIIGEENRVLNIDQDLFRLKIISGILTRSFKNIFSIPIIMFIAFLFLSYPNPNIRLVIFTLVALFLGLILFVPMWQILTTKEYIINSQLNKIYRIIYSNFKVYLIISIISLFIIIALLGIIGYNPDILLKFNPSFQMGNKELHPFAVFINFFQNNHFNFHNGFIFLGVSVSIGFALFLFVYYFLLSISEKNRIKNIKKVKEKTMSEIEKCAAILDDF